MHPDIARYNDAQTDQDQALCRALATIIDQELAEASSKIWHAHPVWFIDDNPIVGYSRQKAGWRLMFWSGKDFGDPALNVLGGKFQDASVFYQSFADVDETALRRWLQQARDIQWDYKNIIRRKGILVRLK